MTNNLPPGCNNPDGLDPELEAAAEDFHDAIANLVNSWSAEDF